MFSLLSLAASTVNSSSSSSSNGRVTRSRATLSRAVATTTSKDKEEASSSGQLLLVPPSSSPLVYSDSSGSSSSSSSSSSNSSDGLPTPNTIIDSDDKQAYASAGRDQSLHNLASSALLASDSSKRKRISWSLAHRPSCGSSPRHRYHPYAAARSGHAELNRSHSDIDSSTPTTSSSPTRPRLLKRNWPGSPSSHFTPKAAHRAPRSILKTRRLPVAQFQAGHRRRRSSTSSSQLPTRPRSDSNPTPRPDLFSLLLPNSTSTAQTGGKDCFLPESPTATRTSKHSSLASSPQSPPRPSRERAALSKSPWKETPFDGRPEAFSGPVSEEKLKEITKLNADGRKHTLSWPDLQSSALPVTPTRRAEDVKWSSMPTTRATQQESMHAPVRGETSAPVSTAQGLDQNAVPTFTRVNDEEEPSRRDPVDQDGNKEKGSSAAHSNVEITQSTPDLDARLAMISALHTLKASLAHPVWVGTARKERDGDDDGRDYSALDFPPRNLQQAAFQHGPEPTAVDGATSTADGKSASHSLPLLREVEGAYSAVFTYVQVWVQTTLDRDPKGLQTVHNPDQEKAADALMALFKELSALLLLCLFRDIHNVLHPVPVHQPESDPAALPSQDQSASWAIEDVPMPQPGQTVPPSNPQVPTDRLANNGGVESTIQADQYSPSIGTPALSSKMPAPTPPTMPSSSASSSSGSSPDTDSTSATAGRPRRHGRSSAEMRRRRTEVNVAEAAVQAFGAILSARALWQAFEVERLNEILRLVAEISNNAGLKSAKYRDLHSAVNWMISAQSVSAHNRLTKPIASIEPASAGQPTILQPETVRQLGNACLNTMTMTAKTGEKAKRVLNETIRALRTLVLHHPSITVLQLKATGEGPGLITTLAAHLYHPVRTLRDNAALFLATLAYGITRGWDDLSPTGQADQRKAQEMVSSELFKFWSNSPGEVELKKLEKALTINAGVSTPTKGRGIPVTARQAGQVHATALTDAHFARLVVNSLPLLLGRRFRKMERRGPHVWLRCALALRALSRNAGSDPSGQLPLASSPFNGSVEALGTGFGETHTLHLLAFIHVTYAWAAASKEAVSRASIAARTQDASLDESARPAHDDAIWALGEKALRVIAQNIDTISETTLDESSTSWNRASLQHSSEVQAACHLIISFIYAFSGLAHTVCWTAESQTRNPNLLRDLTQLWEIFVIVQLPKLLQSSVPELQAYGWNALQAIVRSGDERIAAEHHLRDTWRLERIVSGQLLLCSRSQASRAVDIEAVLQEMVRPSELPAWDGAWVMDNRGRVMEVFRRGIRALRNLEPSSEGGSQSDEGRREPDNDPSSQAYQQPPEWMKSEDGYRILPVPLVNALRAFLNTLRIAAGQQSSQGTPTTASSSLAKEMALFLWGVATNDFGLPDAFTELDGLSQPGRRCAALLAFLRLAEDCFGSEAFDAAGDGSMSLRGRIARDVLQMAPTEADDSAATTSAYAALLSYAFNEQNLLHPDVQRDACQFAIAGLHASKEIRLHLLSLLSCHKASHLLHSGADASENIQDSHDMLRSLIELGHARAESLPRVVQAFQRIVSAAFQKNAEQAWLLVSKLASSDPTLLSTNMIPYAIEWSTPSMILRADKLALNEQFIETTSKLPSEVITAPGTISALSTALSSWSSSQGLALCRMRPFLATVIERLRLDRTAEMEGVYVLALQALRTIFTDVGLRDDQIALPEWEGLLCSGFAMPVANGPQEAPAPSSQKCVKAFVDCWNATFGRSGKTLDYPERLRRILGSVKRGQSTGVYDSSLEIPDLILPGWFEHVFVRTLPSEDMDLGSDAAGSDLAGLASSQDETASAVAKHLPTILDIPAALTDGAGTVEQENTPGNDHARRASVASDLSIDVVATNGSDRSKSMKRPSSQSPALAENLRAAGALPPPPAPMPSQAGSQIPVEAADETQPSTQIVPDTPQIARANLSAESEQRQTTEAESTVIIPNSGARCTADSANEGPASLEESGRILDAQIGTSTCMDSYESGAAGSAEEASLEIIPETQRASFEPTLDTQVTHLSESFVESNATSIEHRSFDPQVQRQARLSPEVRRQRLGTSPDISRSPAGSRGAHMTGHHGKPTLKTLKSQAQAKAATPSPVRYRASQGGAVAQQMAAAALQESETQVVRSPSPSVRVGKPSERNGAADEDGPFDSSIASTVMERSGSGNDSTSQSSTSRKRRMIAEVVIPRSRRLANKPRPSDAELQAKCSMILRASPPIGVDQTATLGTSAAANEVLPSKPDASLQYKTRNAPHHPAAPAKARVSEHYQRNAAQATERSLDAKADTNGVARFGSKAFANGSRARSGNKIHPRPANVLRATVSMPDYTSLGGKAPGDDQQEDSDQDELGIVSSSSPFKRRFDVSDSLTLGRKRRRLVEGMQSSAESSGQAFARLPGSITLAAGHSSNDIVYSSSSASSSSPIHQAASRRQGSGSKQRQAAGAQSTDPPSDLMSALEALDPKLVYHAVQQLPHDAIKLLHRASERALDVRALTAAQGRGTGTKTTLDPNTRGGNDSARSTTRERSECIQNRCT